MATPHASTDPMSPPAALSTPEGNERENPLENRRAHHGRPREGHPPQRVFVTANSEYHCRGEICVAVRDRHTGDFMRHHSAIGKRASAAVRLSEDGVESISTFDNAHPGERLHFATGIDDRHDVLTSPLDAVEEEDPESERWSLAGSPPGVPS